MVDLTLSSLSLTVDNIGTFSINRYMHINFEDFGPIGLDYYWHAHGSLLNENDYPLLWKSWNKYCDENNFEPNLHYAEFLIIMKKLFHMYDLLK